MKEKRANKPIIIAVAIILALLAIFGVVMFLYPALEAIHMRNTTLDRIELAGAGDMIVVSDPRAYEDGIIPTTATAVLEGEDMRAMVSEILRVTDGASYAETRTALMGAWDINIALRTNDGVYTVYFTEGQFYIIKDVKMFVFDIDKDLVQDYGKFYNELYELTEQG